MEFACPLLLVSIHYRLIKRSSPSDYFNRISPRKQHITASFNQKQHQKRTIKRPVGDTQKNMHGGSRARTLEEGMWVTADDDGEEPTRWQVYLILAHCQAAEALRCLTCQWWKQLGVRPLTAHKWCAIPSCWLPWRWRNRVSCSLHLQDHLNGRLELRCKVVDESHLCRSRSRFIYFWRPSLFVGTHFAAIQDKLNNRRDLKRKRTRTQTVCQWLIADATLQCMY